MTQYKSDLLRLLDERGYIHQLTDPEGLDQLAAKEIITGYVGFDATAGSLHVGHMIQILLLRRLQQAGHRPIVVMGGGTTKIGDPSGKDESRKLLTDADIAPISPRSGRCSSASCGSTTARPARSWSTMTNGCPRSITSRSCATSGRISRSTAC
jgi:tyrosyl-tRNA synthetase